MDSHREPSIHWANDIGLKDWFFREEREYSQELKSKIKKRKRFMLRTI